MSNSDFHLMNVVMSDGSSVEIEVREHRIARIGDAVEGIHRMPRAPQPARQSGGDLYIVFNDQQAHGGALVATWVQWSS